VAGLTENGIQGSDKIFHRGHKRAVQIENENRHENLWRDGKLRVA
jgi:hypothetical protein